MYIVIRICCRARGNVFFNRIGRWGLFFVAKLAADMMEFWM
jgi:hypothetical protein